MKARDFGNIQIISIKEVCSSHEVFDWKLETATPKNWPFINFKVQPSQQSSHQTSSKFRYHGFMSVKFH